MECWWNPGGTLPQTSQSLVEPWWNPGGTLVEPYLKPPRTTPPGGTLVELWWNPRGTLCQGCPGPPRSLSGLRPQSFQLLGRKKKTPTQKLAPAAPHVARISRTAARNRNSRLAPWRPSRCPGQALPPPARACGAAPPSPRSCAPPRKPAGRMQSTGPRVDSRQGHARPLGKQADDS